MLHISLITSIIYGELADRSNPILERIICIVGGAAVKLHAGILNHAFLLTRDKHLKSEGKLCDVPSKQDPLRSLSLVIPAWYGISAFASFPSVDSCLCLKKRKCKVRPHNQSLVASSWLRSTSCQKESEYVV